MSRRVHHYYLKRRLIMAKHVDPGFTAPDNAEKNARNTPNDLGPKQAAKGVADTGWQDRAAESDMTPRKGEAMVGRGEKRGK